MSKASERIIIFSLKAVCVFLLLFFGARGLSMLWTDIMLTPSPEKAVSLAFLALFSSSLFGLGLAFLMKAILYAKENYLRYSFLDIIGIFFNIKRFFEGDRHVLRLFQVGIILVSFLAGIMWLNIFQRSSAPNDFIETSIFHYFFPLAGIIFFFSQTALFALWHYKTRRQCR